MRLRTLGGVALEHVAFARPKPLLLLCYLALEGRRPRRDVAELFWTGSSDRMKALTVTLARLRRGAPGSVQADREHLWTTVETDAERFLALARDARHGEALARYGGPFLAGFHLPRIGAELEEWLYRTRELLAGHARRAHLALAEQASAIGDPAGATAHAEAAFGLEGAGAFDDDALRRLYGVLRAHASPLAARARDDAAALGIELPEAATATGQQLRRPATATPGPPRRIGRPRSTAFVGREREIAEIVSRLEERGGPLLTIVGPPGVGKTRIAEQVASLHADAGAFAGGVHLVEAGALRSTDELVTALAHAVGVEPTARARTLDALCTHVGDRDVLLVLDDAERLATATPMGGAQTIVTLVGRCPGVRLLVTSRTRLGLERERVFDLGGLHYPSGAAVTLDEARAADAVALFERRARRARRDFVVDGERVGGVLRVCALVEGLPLALELAASWVRVLGVDEIADELERGLDLLVSSAPDVPERRRSVRAALEHSWRLLPRRARAVLRALAVFEDGFRRDAAGAVAGATLPDLATLVDASLLRSDGSGRYRLHPLVRQDARERLAQGEAAGFRARHRRHYLSLLRRHETALEGSEAQRSAIDTIDDAVPNVLLAWRDAGAEGAVDDLWSACRPLQLFFVQRGGMARVAAASFADAASAVADRSRDGSAALGLVGRLHAAEAWFRFGADDMPRSRAAAERALELLAIAERDPGTGPERGTALARARISALNTLANVAKHEGDLAAAERHLRAAGDLARARDDAAQLAIVTNNLALLAKATGRYEEAERLLGEALARNRGRANTRSVARNLANLGGVLVAAGRPRDAEARLEEALELTLRIGYGALVADLHSNLGGAAHALGDHERARELYRQALDGALERGDRTLAARSHEWLGRVEAALGHASTAREHHAEALELALAIGEGAVVASALLALARDRLDAGDARAAAAVAGAIERHGSLEPVEAERYAELWRALRCQLDEAALDETLRRADALPLERVLAEAFSEAPTARSPDADGDLSEPEPRPATRS